MDTMVILVDVDFLQSDVFFLIQLNDLNKFQTIVDNINNILKCYSLNCKILIGQKYGNIPLARPKKFNTIYTYEELQKSHQTFSHPIHYNSCKSKRANRFVLGSEFIPFANAFEMFLQ